MGSPVSGWWPVYGTGQAGRLPSLVSKALFVSIARVDWLTFALWNRPIPVGRILLHPPPAFQPGPPLGRNDADDIRQIALPFPPALFDGDQAQGLGFPKRVQDAGAADTGTGCDLGNRPGAGAMRGHLIGYDFENGKLCGREVAGQRRGHRAGGSQAAAAGYAPRAIWGPLGPTERKERLSVPLEGLGRVLGSPGAAGAAAGLYRGGKRLGVIVGQETGTVGGP